MAWLIVSMIPVVASAGPAAESTGFGLTHRWTTLVDTAGTPGRDNRTSSVEAAEFSPDGALIVAGSKGVMGDDSVRRGQRVVLIDAADGQILWSRDRADELEAVAFSPDGRYFAAGGEDRLVEVFAVRDEDDTPLVEPRLVATLEHDAAIDGLTFDPAGRVLATGDESRNLNFFAVGSWQRVQQQNHGGDLDWMAVNQIAFSPDGRFVFTAGSDGLVGRWLVYEDVGDNSSHPGYRLKRIGSFSPDGASVKAVDVSPDGRLVAAGTHAGVHVYRRVDGRSHFHPTRRTTEAVRFTPDGRHLIAGGVTGQAPGEQGYLTVLPVAELFGPEPVHATRIDCFRQEYLHFSPDGRALVVSHEDGTATAWDVTP
ncbi:MAG: hypothetical protein AAF710_07575 [Planctomycetota bacterium]